MGSDTSKPTNMKGDLYISLEDKNVIAGDYVRGNVHAHLKDSVASPKLIVFFRGKEVVEFLTEHQESNGDHGAITYQIDHSGKQLIKKGKAIIFNKPNMTVPSGNYCVPFRFRLYEDLPPSFSSAVFTKGVAKLEYKIGALLDVQGIEIMKFKKPINVMSNYFPILPELYPRQISHEVHGYNNTLWCINNEKASLKVWIEKATFGLDESIDLFVEVDLKNFSSDIRRVEVEINKVTTVTANKKNCITKTQSKSLWKDTFKTEILARSGTQNRKFSIPVAAILRNDRTYTMKSCLIKCQYIARVRMHTDYKLFRCTGFPAIEQGIVILPFKANGMPEPSTSAKLDSSISPLISQASTADEA
ncbi:unnamed protein product [Blepharisma stoltei]|uniref:Arrestin-like N-terminal domain-containing protein n=1 Tax=Blepharisma stoltei TaxID=1481888 RepID=A0AAU9ICK2_9CILI|nr:unnamed protein product [Blepharisma stoltei]